MKSRYCNHLKLKYLRLLKERHIFHLTCKTFSVIIFLPGSLILIYHHPSLPFTLIHRIATYQHPFDLHTKGNFFMCHIYYEFYKSTRLYVQFSTLRKYRSASHSQFQTFSQHIRHNILVLSLYICTHMLISVHEKKNK